MAVSTAFQIAQPQVAHLHSAQLHYGKPVSFAHLADLAVLSFGQHEPYLAGVVAPLHQLHQNQLRRLLFLQQPGQFLVVGRGCFDFSIVLRNYSFLFLDFPLQATYQPSRA